MKKISTLALALFLGLAPSAFAAKVTHTIDRSSASSDLSEPVSSVVALSLPSVESLERISEAYVELRVQASERTQLGVGVGTSEDILVSDMRGLVAGEHVVRLDVTKALKARGSQAGASLHLGPVLAGSSEELTIAELSQSVGARLVVFYKLELPDPLEELSQGLLRKVPEDESQSTAQVPVLSVSPNPFNPSTRFLFNLASPTEVTVKLYSLSGRLIRTLHAGVMQQGQHELIWRGEDDGRGKVASGVYIYRATVGDETRAGKLTLLK